MEYIYAVTVVNYGRERDEYETWQIKAETAEKAKYAAYKRWMGICGYRGGNPFRFFVVHILEKVENWEDTRCSTS